MGQGVPRGDDRLSRPGHRHRLYRQAGPLPRAGHVERHRRVGVPVRRARDHVPGAAGGRAVRDGVHRGLAGPALGDHRGEGLGRVVPSPGAPAVRDRRRGVLGGVLLGEVTPVSSSRKEELLGEKQIRSTSSRYNFVYRADGGWVYAIAALQIATRTMTDLILEREGTGVDYPTMVIAAQRALYETVGAKRGTRRGGGHWSLQRGTLRYLLGPEQELAFSFDVLRTRATLQETPQGLLAEPTPPDAMRYAELGRYIDALARSGSDTRKLAVERALKIAIPFICIVVALFGAPLAVSTPRRGPAWGVGGSLATTFVALLMFQLAKAVGAGGVLPPMLAAWFPNLLFGAGAAWLLKRTRT